MRQADAMQKVEQQARKSGRTVRESERTARESECAARRNEREARALRRFLRYAALLRAAGREQKDCTVPPRRAGVCGVLASLPFAAAAVLLYCFFSPRLLFLTGSLVWEPLVAAAALIAVVPLHEGVHALAWAAVHGTFSGIRLRVCGAPQCFCARASGRAAYAFAALAPFAVCGAALSAAGIATGCLAALAAGAFGCIAAGADLLTAFRALGAGRGALLLDHPARCGFYAFVPLRQKNGAEG